MQVNDRYKCIDTLLAARDRLATTCPPVDNNNFLPVMNGIYEEICTCDDQQKGLGLVLDLCTVTLRWANYHLNESMGETVQMLGKYVLSTYGGYYVLDKKTNAQPLDQMDDLNIAHYFCMGNMIKYSNRLGKKNGFQISDIQKTVHYALLLHYFCKREIEKELL
jgi:hypothetical protein